MASVIKKAKPAGAKKGEDKSEEDRPKGGVSDHAQSIVDGAKRHRDELLVHAAEDAKQMLKDGIAAGEAEGTAQAENMRHEIAQLEQRMLAEIEHEVVRTALSVAEGILDQEVRQNEYAVVSITTQALATARDSKEVFLRVHPRHADALREHKARLIDALRRARDVQIREDKKVKTGGVLIQTESGVIDAQLDTQLEEIALLLGA